MHIKPFLNYDHIKDPFWNAFMGTFSHILWLMPLGFVLGLVLKHFS